MGCRGTRDCRFRGRLQILGGILVSWFSPLPLSAKDMQLLTHDGALEFVQRFDVRRTTTDVCKKA